MAENGAFQLWTDGEARHGGRRHYVQVPRQHRTADVGRLVRRTRGLSVHSETGMH